MRSAGCVINDYADRHIDGKVKRTSQRPLATGAVSKKRQKLFVLLILLSFFLVLQQSLCDSVVCRGGGIGVYLSVYEALYAFAATLFGGGIRLVDTDGIWCNSGFVAVILLVAVFSEFGVDNRLRYNTRWWIVMMICVSV